MLIRLFGENYCSLRDHFELSFVAADLKTEGNRGISTLQFEDQDESLNVLRCLVIYGANASGKSTVLNAAKALRWMIRNSSKDLEPSKDIPQYMPFAFCSKTNQKPVSLGCTIFHDGHLYEYTLSYTKNKIESEKLIRFDQPDMVLLEHDKSNIVSGILIDTSDKVKALASQPRKNTPVFSILAQHGPETGDASVRPIWQAFCDRLQCRNYESRGNAFGLVDPIAKRLFQDSRFNEWMLSHLIQPSDLGITELHTEESNYPKFVRFDPDEVPPLRYQTKFLHQGGDTVLSLNQESAGTQKMYSLAEDWWALAHDPVTIFGDELAASLHPLLLEHLVRAINEPAEKHNLNSQLAFATHDVGLLESRDGKPPAVRRDQVYFTKKDETGATELYSLAEFKNEARSVHNLRKRYLEDRYGAIPRIEDLSL